MALRRFYHRRAQNRARQRCASAALGLFALICSGPLLAAEAVDGKALLERNCGRCHAVMAGAESPLKQAPNLWIVLGAYPGERLEAELAEGIGSRHREMPQIQFSSEDIMSIYYYLHGKGTDSEDRRPQ